VLPLDYRNRRGRSHGGQSGTGGHISTENRINERIRVPEVRLVGPNGEQVGIVAINDALRLAQEADLDLVEVAPTARPPVCKLMDYGKYKYESALKARESRKHQSQTVIKEIKLRPKIDPHDYGTKKGHVERFLRAGDKVKVTIMFRGREQSRPDLGYRLLQRLAGDVEELGFVEAQPKQDGRNMIMVIGPHRKKPETKSERAPRPAPRAAEQAEQAEQPAPQAAEQNERAPRAAEQAEQTPRAAEPAERTPGPAPRAPQAAEPAERTPRPAPRAPQAAEPAQRTPRPAPRAPQPGSAGRPVPTPRAPRPPAGRAVAAAKPAQRGTSDTTTGTSAS
jgi:translation initiation factor IF-3